MGIIKENNYTEEEMEISQLFDAISHPARKRILDLLKERYVLRNIDLSDILNLSPTAVMNHLNKLRDSRIISVEYFIHFHVLSLNKERLKKIVSYLETFDFN